MVASLTDVLIVGAGPAGCSLAARLARLGHSVLLLEARRLPRSKPCGDCLSPGATPLLRELGLLASVSESGPARLRGWRARTPAGTWFEGRFDVASATGPDVGLALPRRELDARLLEGALDVGAEIEDGTRAFDLLRSDGRVVGVRARDSRGRMVDRRARWVVGADGLRSVVARRLGGVDRGRRARLAVVGRFRASGRNRGTGGAVRRSAGRTAASLGTMLIGRDGCLGIAPLGRGRLNVTLVIPASEADRMSGDRQGYFRRRVEEYGAGGRVRGRRRIGPLEVTGPFDVTPRRIAAPGAILVGDAAGYFDPLTGQGIYRALAGARAAARVLSRLLGAAGREGERAALRRYRRALAGLTGPARRLQRWIDRVATRPWILEPAGRLLAIRPGLASLLFSVTGDLLPPRALVRPGRLATALTQTPPPSRNGDDRAHP